jgi:GT2 family glycosyltransferase
MLVNANPRVACILLNWNGWPDTLECLAALQQCAYPNLTLIVVDNGSSNDSVERIRAAYPQILLLQALSALVAKALSDDRIGAVASVCYHASAPATVEAWAGARVNLWIGYGRNSTMPQADDWFHSLNGTSMLVSRRALEDAGLLDEGFFLYWEDTEFCLRLRKRGWRIAAAPDSHVLHKVNASTGGNRIVLDRYQTTSGLRLLRLHSQAPRLASLVFLTIRFARRLLRLQFSRCQSVWLGIKDYRQMLPISPRIR